MCCRGALANDVSHAPDSIRSTTAGSLSGLPDNGFEAHGKRANFLLGFREITPTFKVVGNDATDRNGVTLNTVTRLYDGSIWVGERLDGNSTVADLPRDDRCVRDY